MGKLVKVNRSGRRASGRRAHRRIAMEGPMTIYEAAENKRTLLDALGRSAELEIDLSGVSEMDTAGLQLLLLAKREASKAGKVLRLAGHSPAAMNVFNCYQLVGYFGDPVVIPSRER